MTRPISVAWRQVHAFRLRRHHLDRRAPRTKLVDVVGDVCGIQSQVISAAQLALWTRVANLTPQDVERALWRDRTLVKAWSMRGAMHLLPADDYPTYVAALRWTAMRRELTWIGRYGLDPEEVRTITDAIYDVLGRDMLARKELAGRVVEEVGNKARPWIEHGWGGVVKLACLQGRVVFGPNRGREITFVRRDVWLPGSKDVPEDRVGAALVRRYLRAYGPATVQDFGAWSGLPVADAKPMWHRLAGKLVELSIEGRTAWLLRDDVSELRRKPEGERIQLLPSFDCYLLGHRDKEHLVDDAHYKRVYRKAGWLSPVILRAGRVAGVWSHRRIGRGWRLAMEMFERPTPALRQGIAEEAEDLGRFLGGPCDVVYA